MVIEQEGKNYGKATYPTIFVVDNRPEKKIHEWEKSATEARKIIARTTLPNAEALVFDPLMGTGAYLAAALQLGRRVIGVDNNEEMYNIAKANLILQLK